MPTPHTVQVWSIVYFRRGHAKCPLLDKRMAPHFLFLGITLQESKGKNQIVMNLIQKIDICKSCQNCKRGRQGIVCGLTEEKPTFEKDCPNYVVGKEAVSAKKNSMSPFFQAIKDFYEDRYDYEFRTTRSNFWWVQLYLLLARVVICAVSIFLAGITANAAFVILGILALEAFAALNVRAITTLWIRRSHDIGISGWFSLPAIFVDLSGFGYWALILVAFSSNNYNYEGITSSPVADGFIIIAFVLLLSSIAFIPGQKRDNKYGKYPVVW